MKIRIQSIACLPVALLLFTFSPVSGQGTIRPAEQLINTAEPGWPVVEGWIKAATNKVEVLPADAARGKEALFGAQVTTRSPLGAIIYSTGGILVDGGWLRILGSGHPRLPRSVPSWNKGKSADTLGDIPAFLLIADDAAGGFYAINNGQFGADEGKVYYNSPDNLEWEPLDLGYSAFLGFCFNGDLTTYYSEMRWKGWQSDVAKLGGDSVYTFAPFLFTKEGRDINKVEKGVVPIAEQFDFMLEMRAQLGLDKK
jgi:hypothetical protein